MLSTTGNSLRQLFQLQPDVVFLNHGSFGACPRPVFERYQQLQAELERQPVAFVRDQIMPLLAEARTALAAFLGAAPDDLAYVPNATFGVNVVARSLRFEPGDEILSTDHEYGACENTWDFIGRKSGTKFLRMPVDLPAASDQDLADAIWTGVTPRTKLIFLSHISSSTALTFPIAEICRRARGRGILTLVDGAHAPGQIPLDLSAIGADFYTGNCHKWMMSPKGAGFLYADPAVQDLIEPFVVSWGYSSQPGVTTGSAFLDNLQWLGTSDPSAYLSVPAAIDFMAMHDWDTVRSNCHRLLSEALGTLETELSLENIYTSGSQYAQMAAIGLPTGLDAPALKTRLYDAYRIEVPVTRWRDRDLIRISIQGYNIAGDVDALVSTLAALL